MGILITTLYLNSILKMKTLHFRIENNIATSKLT